MSSAWVERWTGARPWVGLVARLLLGVVWLWASIAKLADPRGFVQAVRAYDATPEWLSKGIGYGLPVLEFCLGVVLVLGVTVRIAAAVSAVLFVVFLIGLVQAAVRGLQLTCGCFGGGGLTQGSTNYTWDILRDIGLLIVAVYLVVWSFSALSIEAYLARHDYVAPPSAKRMRTPEGRKRYEAQLAVVRASARNRNLYLTSSIVIVVALVSLIGIGVQAQRGSTTVHVTPKNATLASGVVYGKAAAAKVDIYEDFACPVCEQFEQATSAKLQRDVRANLAQVHYHVISFLDRSSPNKYSSRAANAGYCASDVTADDFIRFHNILYGSYQGKKVQPTEGTPGPTNYQLELYGKKAGIVPPDFSQFQRCINVGEYDEYVTAATDKSSQLGVTGTPTVFVNGKKVTASGSALFGAIRAANVGHTPHPSPTPSPTSFGSSSTSSGSGSASPSGSAAESGSAPAGGSGSPKVSPSASK